MKRLFFCGLVVVILTACAPQVQYQRVESTRLVPATVEVTRLVEVTRIVVVTSTPVPPTPTPIITQTPVFQQWTSLQVIEAFKNSNLEVGETHPMMDEDYGLSPARAAEAVRFRLPSLCDSCNGRVFNYDDPTQLEIGKAYFDRLGENNPIFFSWTFVRDNILVQLSGDLPKNRAQEYENVLNEMQK